MMVAITLSIGGLFDLKPVDVGVAARSDAPLAGAEQADLGTRPFLQLQSELTHGIDHPNPELGHTCRQGCSAMNCSGLWFVASLQKT
ncbi:hypothetical protein [Spirosoma agri]|nr:hypothetical protein [Spirosoma agri]